MYHIFNLYVKKKETKNDESSNAKFNHIKVIFMQKYCCLRTESNILYVLWLN